MATFAVAATVLGLAAGVSAAAGSAFGWFKAAPAPSSWKALSVPSGGAILFYPPSFTKIRSDSASVSAAQRDAAGRVALYVNATPKQLNETLANWVAFRIAHNRGESEAVHLDGQASGLRFIAARGTCVTDDYRTRSKANHYREIACFVRGRTTSAVIVVAALQSEWSRSAPLLERAVEAFLVD